jgi:hypothetical protein
MGDSEEWVPPVMKPLDAWGVDDAGAYHPPSRARCLEIERVYAAAEALVGLHDEALEDSRRATPETAVELMMRHGERLAAATEALRAALLPCARGRAR